MTNTSNENDDSFSLLKVHEWLAIAVVIGVIGGLACLTSFYERGEVSKVGSELVAKSHKGFDVLIKGAVTHPGIYHINSETKMKEVLALAGVRSDADLRRFNLDAIVKKGRVINVPLRAMITVHLKGAVKTDQTVTLPKGSKFEELLNVGDFTADADLNALKKKRRLKEGEIILVPFLKK